MFSKIALFEMRYQFRTPVFWAALLVFFLLTLSATASENIRIGSGGRVHVNAPTAILETQILLSVFYIFVITAFVANVVIRDDETGFGPLVRSTQITKFNYLIGRFAGACAVALITFMAVPLAIFLGSLMPWLDPETVGPNKLSWYVKSYLLFAAPTVFLLSAVLFSVATVTRSMIYSYVTVVGILVAYATFNSIIWSEPDLREFASLADPLGFGAVFGETRYWTSNELNTRLPSFAGAILANRLGVIAFAILVLAFTYKRFRFSERAPTGTGAKASKFRKNILADAKPQIVEALPDSEPDRSVLIRLAQTTRFEAMQVFRSPAFVILLALAILNSVNALGFGNDLYGTPQNPATFLVIPRVLGSFALIPIIIAIYYGGELVWRDRDRKLHEVIDSTSLPGWAYMAPKTIAVTIVLIATLLISVLTAMAVQATRGYFNFEVDKYFAWYVAPTSVDLLLIAVLSVFVQSMSPNKYVGWGIMALYLVATVTFADLGLGHPLLLYGTLEMRPISDMNGAAATAALDWWLRIYWGGFALVFAVLAHLMWPRGIETRLRHRLSRLPARFVSSAGALGLVGVLTASGSGAFLFNQMNVENTYRDAESADARLAEYEKKYLKFADLKQPSITDISLIVDLFPKERRMEARGTYQMINDTGVPIEFLHVRLMDTQTELREVSVASARLEQNDESYQHRIYRFDEPLAPGEKAMLTFSTSRSHKAFSATGYGERLVENGTFMNNAEIAPVLGMDIHGLLGDRTARKRHGLDPDLRMPKLEDQQARERNFLRNADWVNADITITTSADQIPVAPGSLVSDVTKGERRIARFRSSAPILNFFSIQSADYKIARRDADGVELQVFFDPQHPYNIERMLDAMQHSLTYYSANFGPYQFDYARIVEFPAYARFAQAFAGTMPVAENFGFLADLSDPNEIDYTTYVIAHEIAHQYWGHQMVSAEMQGGTMLIETLAQYSALMVMEEIYGADQMRRFLKYELDSYLRARGRDVIEELPLERVENQSYIHYRKGSVVMYLLQSRLGESRVNAMLAGLLDKYRFRSQPYASSADLVDGFLSLARNENEKTLIRDLLQRITIYDLKAEKAVSREIEARFETIITLSATKYFADGTGLESEAPLNDRIEVGLFTDRPGEGTFSEADVIKIERRPLSSGRQEVRFVSNKRPTWVGVDPYNMYIDRNSNDNLTAVE